jgi:hypothetical protein
MQMRCKWMRTHLQTDADGCPWMHMQMQAQMLTDADANADGSRWMQNLLADAYAKACRRMQMDADACKRRRCLLMLGCKESQMPSHLGEVKLNYRERQGSPAEGSRRCLHLATPSSTLAGHPLQSIQAAFFAHPCATNRTHDHLWCRHATPVLSATQRSTNTAAKPLASTTANPTQTSVEALI